VRIMLIVLNVLLFNTTLNFLKKRSHTPVNCVSVEGERQQHFFSQRCIQRLSIISMRGTNLTAIRHTFGISFNIFVK
jgi:hypothetical protein